MMTAELKDAVAVVQFFAQAIIPTVPGSQQGRASSDVRRQANDLYTNAEMLLRNGTLSDGSHVGDVMLNLVTTAVTAGATFDNIYSVLVKLNAQTVNSLLAQACKDAGIILLLAALVQITSNTTFVSRADAQAYLTRMLDGFTPAIEILADVGDVATYRQVLSLQAVMVHDLTERARPLPTIIHYQTAVSYPALKFANWRYPDSTITPNAVDTDMWVTQLISENKIVHPAFMPVEGRLLTVA
jgi:prophage DNA circulation protein